MKSRTIGLRFNKTDYVIIFLSKHKYLHKLLDKTLRSRLAKSLVTLLCYVLARRYGIIDLDKFKNLLGSIASFRSFCENTIINAFSEMQQLSPSNAKLQRVAQGFTNLGLASKARLFRRLFYSIILRSLNRMITKLRYGERIDFAPNLSVLLFAPFDRCNLNCKGCVTESDRSKIETPSLQRMNYVIEQAKRLNVFHVVITGKGEPFYSQEDKDKLFKLAKKHDDLNFAIFTNGTTIHEKDAVRIKRLENIYPIISLDGLKEVNDLRRSDGVYEQVMNSMSILNRYGIIFGYCATVYRENYCHVLSSEFVSKMIEMGSKFGIYLKFLPLAQNAQVDMILTKHDELKYDELFEKIKDEVTIPLIDFDKFERLHGCRARRGSIIYIDGVTGKVTPCVKTPYAPPECNIYINPHKNRLLEILRTEFFFCYRASYEAHKQCSQCFADEINTYIQIPEERERLNWVREKLNKV